VRIRVYFPLYGSQEEFLVLPACRDEQRLIKDLIVQRVLPVMGDVPAPLHAHRLAEIFANVEAFDRG
jgi:hypothetical protein